MNRNNRHGLLPWLFFALPVLWLALLMATYYQPGMNLIELLGRLAPAMEYAGAEDGIDVTALDADRVDKLTDVFWDMTAIISEVESINDEEREKRILHIAVIAKTTDEMKTVYGFTDYQCSALDEVLRERTKLEAHFILEAVWGEYASS